MRRFQNLLAFAVIVHVAFAGAVASTAVMRGTTVSGALPVGFVALWLAAFVSISGYLIWVERAVTVGR